jgi:hypothetical protein
MKILVQLLDDQIAWLLHRETFYALFGQIYKLVGQNHDEVLIWESAGSPPSYLIISEQPSSAQKYFHNWTTNVYLLILNYPLHHNILLHNLRF